MKAHHVVNLAFVVGLAVAACAPARSVGKALVDVAGAQCTEQSIELRDPVLGLVCTTAAELAKALLADKTLAARRPEDVTNADLMRAIITLRKEAAH
jgi:hypothetical protein